MEATLDIYHRPYDPQAPIICFDETSKQLIAETRTPLPLSPGEVQRYDTEYERKGTANLFMFFEALGNWRHVKVTNRRTKLDFAHCMKDLSDVHYPDASIIHVVLDNLNTHTLAALYDAFPAPEAHRIAQRLQFHHTPKHGSWLNMAEIEFSALFCQALNKRIPDQEILKKEVLAWETNRNINSRTIDWKFTSTDARVRLKKLYPTILMS